MTLAPARESRRAGFDHGFADSRAPGEVTSSFAEKEAGWLYPWTKRWLTTS